MKYNTKKKSHKYLHFLLITNAILRLNLARGIKAVFSHFFYDFSLIIFSKIFVYSCTRLLTSVFFFDGSLIMIC